MQYSLSGEVTAFDLLRVSHVHKVPYGHTTVGLDLLQISLTPELVSTYAVN